jgi:hypothetical protein
VVLGQERKGLARLLRRNVFPPKWLVLLDNSFLTSMQELQMKSRERPPMHTCLFVTSITRRVLELGDRVGQLNGYQLLFGIGEEEGCTCMSRIVWSHLELISSYGAWIASNLVRSFSYHSPQAWEFPGSS